MTKKEMILKECKAFLDKNDIGYNEYEENGAVCGIDCEFFTDLGVDMCFLLDGRNRDMENPNWWRDALEEEYDNFDIDEEIECHRQGKDYREQFTISQSLQDFKDYEDWLEDITIKAYAYK